MTELTPTRILIVDDEYPVRVSLGSYLEDRDFDVFSAESAEETLDLLRRMSFHCLIVDMRLSGLDGNALILRAHEAQPSLKFLIHTGSTDYRPPQCLLTLGVSPDDVFLKPVPDMQVIVDAIDRLVGKPAQ